MIASIRNIEKSPFRNYQNVRNTNGNGEKYD